jgi:hypothetical protein
MCFVVAGFPGCGGVLTAPSGDILSPNHPDGYRENVDCEWHIQLPVGERIHLTFLTFSLEASSSCYFDYVAVSKTVIILSIWKFHRSLYSETWLIQNSSSFPFPFVPLQRRGCLVAPWFL